MERLNRIGSHLASGVAFPGPPDPYTPATEPAVTTFKEVDGGDDLSLHIFSPAAGERGEPAACAVFFFGGGWVNGNPGQFFPHCAYLASRGMVPPPSTSPPPHSATDRHAVRGRGHGRGVAAHPRGF